MGKKKGKKGKQQQAQEEETPETSQASQAPQTQPAASVSEPAPPKAPQVVAPAQSLPEAVSTAQPPVGIGRGKGKGRGRETVSPFPGPAGQVQAGPPPGPPIGPPQTAPGWGPRPGAPAPSAHVPSQVPQTQSAASVSEPAPPKAPQVIAPAQSLPEAVSTAQPPVGIGRGKGKGRGRGTGTVSPFPGPAGQVQAGPPPGPPIGPSQTAPGWGPRPGAPAPSAQHVPSQLQHVAQQQASRGGPGQQTGLQQPQAQPAPQFVPQQQQAPQYRPQQPQQAAQARPQQPQQAPQARPQQPQQAPQARPQQPQQAPQARPQQPQQASQQRPQQSPQVSQPASPAKSGSPSAMKSTADAMAKLSLIPCRKNPSKAGTAGRPITVEANVMSISFAKNFNPHAVHYDIAFDPDKPKFMLRRAYNVVHQQYFPNRHPAFDGRKNLYSSGLLPFGTSMAAEVEVFDPEREQQRTYKVTISKVADVDLSWLPRVATGMTGFDQTGLQVIDVVLRNGPASRCVTVGRSFFSPPQGQVVDLGNGLELWVGMFQSAIVGWKPFLNVDVAHKGFPKAINVVDFMREMCGRSFTPNDVYRMKSHIAKQLKGLKVIYEIPGQPTSRRTQRINDLMESAVRNRFKLDTGVETTIYDYFLREKRYKIQHPELPCIWVGGRNRNIHVPAELCTITPGQVIMKKMDEIQTSNMIKSAATNTDVRKQKIMDAFASINFNNDPCVREFGLSVGGGFEKVPARVLDPPMLMYDRPVKVSRGVWNASRFNKAAQLEPKSWTILNVNGRYTHERDLHKLAGELISNGNSCGMMLGEPLTPFTTMDPPMRDVRKVFEFLERNKNLKLIIVVLPDRGTAYSKVKQSAEIKIGVLTQCIRARTLSRLTSATTSNILLKINSKLNGVNHTLMDGKLKPKCLNRPCIIIGADVTHPPPDAIDVPSIAAVAASHDARAQFMYNIKTQLQPPREEIILDLQRMVREQLMYFYKTTGHQPQQIIFYRDGVSEGQFGQVLSRELEAIKRACASLSANFKPPITFLVVQKRHHVRLFPTDKRNSDDRNGNVQAGTVVDTVITHPAHIDFYLVSHASIQGVARPTKYRCLWDDSNMTEDEIEQLTYYLCHMFSRCTRSVSYPAPTYYAHLAAYRARVHTEDLTINIHNLDEEQRKNLTLAAGMVQNPMFFV